ncbi:MAG TPA: hypothetical protein VFF76_09990 [Holophagaceae bacterium]|jgi:hypothetical protein|nr:hypothetical protein [Holophagaceae bacterium]
MRSVLRVLPLFLSLAAPAADPSAVLGSARQVWPDNAGFAVVCNYGMSREAVAAAAQAASENGFRTLTVLDIHRMENMGQAVSYLGAHNARLVILLPKDPVAGDGTFGATALVQGLNGYGIPACSTRRIALSQGAAMAQGEDTNGLLLTQGVDYTFTHPTILKPVRTSRLTPPADIQVVSFR